MLGLCLLYRVNSDVITLRYIQIEQWFDQAQMYTEWTVMWSDSDIYKVNSDVIRLRYIQSEEWCDQAQIYTVWTQCELDVRYD